MSMETGDESLSVVCSFISVSVLAIFLVVDFCKVYCFLGLVDIVALRVGYFIGEPPP